MIKFITQNKSWYAKGIRAALAALFWLAVWQILSMVIDRKILFPSPADTLRALGDAAGGLSFWLAVLGSMRGILSGYLCGLLAGSILAALTCRFSLLRLLLSPFLTVIKATPVASIIILALVWLDKITIPAVMVVLMVTPIVWENVSAGILSADRGLLEVGRVYRFGAAKKLKYIYFPTVLPYLGSAATASLGLAWKAGVAAEVLCTPAETIGKLLYDSKIYLETADLFAYTLVVVLISIVLEKLIRTLLNLIKRRRRA